LLSTDIGLEPSKAFGQDQWALDVETNEVTQLTATPDVWDEHGIFSPDGNKIVFMSTLPYRKTATWIGNIKTEFLLMDADGNNVTQLTHFNVPGFEESTTASVAAIAFWSNDGTQLWANALTDLATLVTWEIQFAGPCGGTAP